jgi:hypothetical protein
MGNSTGDRASPTHARPHRYLAELERLPDGRLRATLYRDGHPVHREWVRSQRHGRRRVIDLICTAVDTDPHTPHEDEPGSPTSPPGNGLRPATNEFNPAQSAAREADHA